MFEGITPSVPMDFVRKLKAIDKGLDCHFDRKVGRFMITQTGKISGKVPLGIVKGDDGGGYRYPDDRDIKFLQAADTHRKGQEIKDRVRKGEEYMQAHREKQDKDVAEEIKVRTKEDKQQLLKGFADTYNLGKYNSAHRRIEIQKKGAMDTKRGFKIVDKRSKICSG